jgi:hypothetical protein
VGVPEDAVIGKTMAESSGGWVHLVLKEEVYVNFGVAPVPIPITNAYRQGEPRDFPLLGAATSSSSLPASPAALPPAD